MELLPRRQQQVLQATVHHYVDTVEPVGSRTRCERFGIKASSATVRSAMGALEQKGPVDPAPHLVLDGFLPGATGQYKWTRCCLNPEGRPCTCNAQLAELSLIGRVPRNLLHQLASRLSDLTGL